MLLAQTMSFENAFHWSAALFRKQNSLHLTLTFSNIIFYYVLLRMIVWRLWSLTWILSPPRTQLYSIIKSLLFPFSSNVGSFSFSSFFKAQISLTQHPSCRCSLWSFHSFYNFFRCRFHTAAACFHIGLMNDVIYFFSLFVYCKCKYYPHAFLYIWPFSYFFIYIIFWRMSSYIYIYDLLVIVCHVWSLLVTFLFQITLNSYFQIIIPNLVSFHSF